LISVFISIENGKSAKYRNSAKLIQTVPTSKSASMRAYLSLLSALFLNTVPIIAFRTIQ